MTGMAHISVDHGRVSPLGTGPHLPTAVILMAPGTLMMAKMFVPETETPETRGTVARDQGRRQHHRRRGPHRREPHLA
jgi:nucleoside permease NupC